ncbi:hypothetical protein [Rhodothermus marinus]|uniref:hypothetical protein n=1 Tax=Rhodothermus marinus TaxID=29549 RepID=UPI000B2E5A70|nr:hypothetical protein [Rhodothermus marinus]
MYRILAGLVLLFCVPAFAQHLQPLSTTPTQHAPDSYILHVTDRLNRRPEVRQALEDFHRRKALGLLPATPTIQAPPQVGDRQPFKVYNFETETTESREFELRVIEDRFYLWVEVASLDSGWVTDEKLEALRAALADATPAGSINPNQALSPTTKTFSATRPMWTATVRPTCCSWTCATAGIPKTAAALWRGLSTVVI